MTEEWRPCPGYPGRYEVSNLGRVRSLRFRSNGGPQIMRVTPNYAGYLVVTLGADRKQYRVHVLVLTAFKGPCPPGQQGCHNDNNRANAALDNLRWDTPAGNAADRRSYAGEKNPRAKLTDAQRAEISIRAKAELHTRLAVEFGVSAARIGQISREGVTRE